MRNFEADDLLIFNVASKPLPFRKKLNSIKKATYNVIAKELSKKQYKRYVIDDSQYLLAFDSFNRAKETGYAKFTDMAVRFQKMITFIIEGLPDDTIVYFYPPYSFRSILLFFRQLLSNRYQSLNQTYP